MKLIRRRCIFYAYSEELKVLSPVVTTEVARLSVSYHKFKNSVKKFNDSEELKVLSPVVTTEVARLSVSYHKFKNSVKKFNGMVKVKLLWNYGKLCDIVDKQSDIPSTVIKRAKEKCSSVGASFETLSFTKLSKKTNRYRPINLNDISDGDKINIVSKSSSQSVSKIASSFATDETESQMNGRNGELDGFSKSNLIKKLQSNRRVKLTDEERKFLYNHLELHSNCSSAKKNCQCSSPNSQELIRRRKIANSNEVETTKRRNDPTQELHTSILQMTKSAPQTDRQLTQILKEYKPVKYDYELIRKYLNRNYILPPEERDQKMFLICFRILFESRRAFMIGRTPTVPLVKKLHPYLFNKELVFAEFELLTERENMFKRYEENVKKYCSSAVEVTVPCPSQFMVIDKYEQAEDREQKEWIVMAGSLLLLPKYMGEDRRSMIVCNGEYPVVGDTLPHTLPHIRCYEDTGNCLAKKCRYEVIVENVKLCTVANIIEAFFGLMATYYIFDVKYPTECKKTLVLFERLYTEFTTCPTEIPESAERRITYLKEYDYRKRVLGEVFNYFTKI